MYKNAANLYNTLLAVYFNYLYNTLLVAYFNYYNNIADEVKEEMDKKHDPRNLFLKYYKYDE